MTVAYGAPARVSPPNYWALSLVAFFFSFLIGGIAMYFSYQVGQRFNANDDDGAQRASRNAKAWGIVGIVVGVIVFLVIVGSQ
jgi:Na+-driven multidrug efflux pump